jgi:hypothetical protein
MIMEDSTKSMAVGCPARPGDGITRKYNISKRLITPKNAGQIPIGVRVNAFSVKNAGTTLVIFNREELQPQESQSIGGNEGEEYVGRVDISFETQAPPPLTIVNRCWLTIKYYA